MVAIIPIGESDAVATRTEFDMEEGFEVDALPKRREKKLAMGGLFILIDFIAV
jgi:hypothetical protein